jgi:hypothetical protein
VELQLQSGVEIDPQTASFGFTLRPGHLVPRKYASTY